MSSRASCPTCGQPWLPPRECARCGATFAPAVHNQRYCSRECRVAWHHAYPVPATCAECDEPYVQRNSLHLYCSNRCSGRARYAREHAGEPPRVCANPECLAYVADDNRRKYCSEACARRAAHLKYLGRTPGRKRRRDAGLKTWLRARAPKPVSDRVCGEAGCSSRVPLDSPGDLCGPHQYMTDLIAEKASA